MTRVSDRSQTASVEFSINKAKTRLEDLQMKGTTLKRMVKPSDDPSGNLTLMQLRSNQKNLEQFKKNCSIATTYLEFTDDSLKELADLLNKAKEIAIAQSSDIYNADIRHNIAKEIKEIQKQAYGIANRRLGNRYIFGGYKTDSRPFEVDGKYNGDQGAICLELNPGFYVPINLPGKNVFFLQQSMNTQDEDPLAVFDKASFHTKVSEPSETLADGHTDSIFAQLQTLTNSLNTNDPDGIQALLERLDLSNQQIVTLRTQVGSVIDTIRSAENNILNSTDFNTQRQSEIEDADIAELYSDLAKQNQVLKAVYKTSANLLDEGLLKFLR